MKYICQQNVRHKGKLHHAGQEIDLTEAEAASVQGAVIPAPAPEPTPAKAKGKAAAKGTE